GSFLPFGGGVETQTNKARVVIDIRMIDTSTGQILKADKGEGEESSTGVSIDLSSAPSVSFGKEGFDETVIGKATRKCVDMVIKAMVDSLGNQPWSAKIVKVSGKEIYLNSGKKDNEQVGRVIGIYRKGEELIDPDTGLSLGSENTKIGTAKIIKVDENFSVAETSAENVTKDDYLKEEK
ncbi:hypothetical protein HY745_13920, partial [Candidatus Desantisbacteria bacterium]|nr:hypothetical protein [Candidatus Desantisbacteria bacterium]